VNLEKFKQAYVRTISESADDSDLKNYIRSIVEEVLQEKYAKNDYDKIFAREGSKCKKCKKGVYKIMTLPDDWEGRLTCTNPKCGHQVRKAQPSQKEYNEVED